MSKQRKGIFGGTSTSSHGVVDDMLKRQLAKDGRKVEAFFSKSTTRQDVFNVDTLILIFKSLAEHKEIQMYINEDMKGMENGLKPAFRQFLRGLRLASRSVNKAVIPFFYRSYDISGAKILNVLATGEVTDKITGKPNGMEEVKANILAHCRYLLLPVSDNMQWMAVALRILNDCVNLKHIAWRSLYDKELALKTRERLACRSTTYLNTFLRKNPRCCFATENMRWLHAVDISSGCKQRKPGFVVPTFVEKLHMKNIPENALRQLPQGGSHFLPVKDLILERSACYGDMFESRSNMIELWNGPIWDLRQLESLEFNNIQICDFLAPIPLEQLSGLQKLMIKGDVIKEGEAMRETNDRLADLLEVCQQLKELEVKYGHWHKLFQPLSVINVCGKTLRRLQLSDLDNNQARRTMTTPSLCQIQASCTELVDLSLDVNMYHSDASEFLNNLARFPNLRNLELTASTDLAKYPKVRDNTDPDFDSTKVIFKQLHSQKIGLSFHEITIRIVHCRQPHGNQVKHYDPYYYNGIRVFKYGVNGYGQYEQWGSTRFLK